MSAPVPSKSAAALFAVTIGVGAFLLFQVQFILGKQVLPWFGGASAVWTTCQLFFQLLLLLGYGYAHLLGSSRDPARQRTIHLAALGLAAVLLLLRVAVWPSPITPSDAWKPAAGAEPIAAILGLLLFTIGLPFLVLATTGPLVQNWFARVFPGRSPYRLYALSNLGSLLGLLSYPFLLEPGLPLAGQGWVWSAGFLVFAAACGGCAVLVGKTEPLPPLVATAGGAERPPTVARRALWFGLAMVASVLLLAITSQISLEVAVIPFLWMLPLSLYLLSFILCFEYERVYHRGVWMPLLLLGAGGTAALIRIGVDAPMIVQLVVYLGTLFAACMVCHGEVVRHKPDPRHLTGFYLWVSAGGAAGGVFTGVVAPTVFPDLWELPLALIAAGAFAVGLILRARPAPLGFRPWEALVGAGLLAVLAAIFTAAAVYGGPPLLVATSKWIVAGAGVLVVAATLGVAWAIGRLIAARTPRLRETVARVRWIVGSVGLFAYLLALIGVLAWHAREEMDDYMVVDRGFFGVLRVDQDVGTSGELRTRLKHGRIIHGIQFADPDLARMPTSYYGPGSAVGLAIRHHPRRLAGQPMKLGFVGLGAGTLATYANRGDAVRFYEINPDVVALSAGPDALFTYVRDCVGSVEISLGDARVNLEREDPQGFQVLALDAFSSDSIPAHLLTLEAGRLYMRHLAADGILAIHISNRYLDLDPVVRGLADALGLVVVRIDDSESNDMVWQSDWMLLARDEAPLAAPEIQGAASDPPESHGLYPLWTDAYSNLLEVFKG